jgi:hypothetical protein
MRQPCRLAVSTIRTAINRADVLWNKVSGEIRPGRISKQIRPGLFCFAINPPMSIGTEKPEGIRNGELHSGVRFPDLFFVTVVAR